MVLGDALGRVEQLARRGDKGELGRLPAADV